MLTADICPIRFNRHWLQLSAVAIGLIVLFLRYSGGPLLAEHVVADSSDDDHIVEDQSGQGGEFDRLPPEMAESEFDRFLFGNRSSAAAARARFENILTKKLAALHRTCGLSDGLRSKLELAGRGDLKRFFDRIDGLRTEVCNPDSDTSDGQFVWNKLTMRKCEWLQRKLSADLFGYGSLFDKTLRNTLSPEQLVRYKRWELSNWNAP